MDKHIIACIDGSTAATAVCDWAAWSSTQLQAPLTLLHVLEKTTRVENANLSGVIGMDSREDLLEQLTQLDEQREQLALTHGKHMLASAKQRVAEGGVATVDIRQRHGALVATLSELEATTRLLVMGRQGEQSERQQAQIGSQLENVIRTLHCPILVALGEFKTPHTFMLAYDGSATAHTALTRVIESPLLQGLACHLVMMGDHQSGKLKEADTLLTKAGVNTVAKNLPGDNVALLSDYAQRHNIDLIIMGAYGHSRIRQFFIGSNTATLLRTTQTPLLVLR